MPIEPPPTVTTEFLAAIAAATWQSDHLIDPVTGGALYPAIQDGAWIVTSEGLHLGEGAYNSLASGSAGPGGSYTSPSGGVWWLRDVRGWALPSTS